MPIYEYKCTTCDFSFERKQSFDAATVCACPQCQNEARRLFRPAPIIFKGSGFYVTDYASGSSSTLKNSRSEDSEGSQSDSAASEKKSKSSED